MSDAQMIDDPKAKRAVNLSLPAALVAEAKAAGLNLSEVAAGGIREALASYRKAQWEREQAAGIAAYNERVAAEGLWSDGLRTF
jgi:antitoxin CcdA